jgi:hypothetical protein
MLNVQRSRACNFFRMIPEIDIWRAAQLMVKRYGDRPSRKAARADELAAAGDDNGVATWRRISVAVTGLANMTPRGAPH